MSETSLPPLPPLPEVLEAVRGIVLRAGNLAVEIMGQAEGELKEDFTLVTVVDKKVEQFLRQELEPVLPGVGFLGEEYGQQGSMDRVWVLDPIDGTNNLVFGIPLWGVSVGLVEKGESILGVFYMPLTNEMFTACKGGGAFLNGTLIQARKERAEFHQHCLGITTEVAKFWDLTLASGYLRLLGSIAGEIVYAAKGTLYATISLGDKLVDLGAAVCIAKEAGCELAYYSGAPFHLGAWFEGPPPPDPLIIGPQWAIDDLRKTIKPRTEG